LKTFKFLALFAAAAALSVAQNPISVGQKIFFGMVSHNVIAGAEAMPEENYSFKPTPEVRSFAQLVGHAADAEYSFCSTAAGEKPPASSSEKSKTSKADLVQAVKDASAYCDKVYGAMTDDHASDLVKMMGRDMAKVTVLTVNTAHLDEHYGNMVTYLRLKGIVPPSSAPKK
jgi:uncharacterized damage-inducible protein DinB